MGQNCERVIDGFREAEQRFKRRAFFEGKFHSVRRDGEDLLIFHRPESDTVSTWMSSRFINPETGQSAMLMGIHRQVDQGLIPGGNFSYRPLITDEELRIEYRIDGAGGVFLEGIKQGSLRFSMVVSGQQPLSSWRDIDEERFHAQVNGSQAGFGIETKQPFELGEFVVDLLKNDVHPVR